MISLTSPVRTPYHRIPAGAKLALVSAVTFCLFLTGDIRWLGAALLAVAGLYLGGGRAFARAGFRALRPLWPFLAVIFLWHALTGTLAEGAGIAARLFAAVGMANLVTMTTRLDDMIALLNRLFAPLARIGLPVAALGTAIALVIRFTPVLAQKGGALAEAWRARSARRPGWRIMAPFALTALDDADHVAEALRARGGIL